MKHVGSSANQFSDNIAPLGILKSSKADLLDFEFPDEYDYDDYDDDVDYFEGFDFENGLVDNDYNSSLAAKFDDLDLPTGVEANVAWLQTSGSEQPSRVHLKTVVEDAIDLKYKAFKQFDTIQGEYDHYFARPEHVKGIKAVKKVLKFCLDFFFSFCIINYPSIFICLHIYDSHQRIGQREFSMNGKFLRKTYQVGFPCVSLVSCS